LISYNLHYKTINDKRAADKTKAQVHPDGRPENKYLKSNSFIYIGKIFKIKVIFEMYTLSRDQHNKRFFSPQKLVVEKKNNQFTGFDVIRFYVNSLVYELAYSDFNGS